MSFLLTICVVIYFFWDRRRKKPGSSIVRKTVWCVVLILCTLISISAVKVSVEEIKDNYEMESKAGRLQRASRERQRGDYGYLAETLTLYCDYEEEFEPDWEGASMYRYRWMYTMFRKASERMPEDEAMLVRTKEYEQKLLNICEYPSYEENREYGQYLLKTGGLK